jgi:hypothetical protein
VKETDVGAAVVALLCERGFEVYQEVLCAWGSCCDIVATRGPLLVAVECKVSLTYEVMHQALRWVPYAHHSYVAVGIGPYGIDRLAHRLLEDLGLGCIGVRDGRTVVGGVGGAEALVDPRWNRRVEDRLRRQLREEQKTFAPAGSSSAARWSPFKGTVRDLQAYVRAHPGCSMKEAVAGIKHHYPHDRGARSALVHYIDEGVIDGVRVEREGRAIRLYPEPVPVARRFA